MSDMAERRKRLLAKSVGVTRAACYAFCQMRRRLIGLVLILVAGPVHSSDQFSVRDLVFLTRDGCGNTASMRSRLDQALKAMALPTHYALIDVDKLEPSDTRRGYGTPTILYKNRDLFGIPAPPAQPSAPS
jgi:hypothetical protein